jgi:hypothetical protein
MNNIEFKKTKRIYLSRIIIVTLSLLLNICAFSQIKIGDNPTIIDANSILELEHTNKGVLIPRVSIDDLSNEAPLTATVAEGTLVYNINGSTENGFYYWNGTKWQLLLTNVTKRDNYVLVKSEADLPVPSGGIITLAAGVFYEINGTVLLTNQIALNGSYIQGADANNDKLIYTPSSGALFTGGNGGTIKVLTLSAPNAGAKVFDVNASIGSENVIMRDCNIGSSDNIGTIKGFNIVFMSVVNFYGNQNGITYENIGSLLIENMAWFSNNSNTFETYIGTFSLIQKLGGFSEPLIANSAIALDVSGIISLLSGSMKTVDFSGDGTMISGSFSKKWEVESSGIDTETDDVSGGNIYITSVSTTTISSSSTPVKISGTTSTANLFRFTAPVSNRMVYDGTKTRKFQVMAAISMTSPSNNKIYKFYIAKNGTVLPETGQLRKIASGSDVGALSIFGVVELVPGDYVEVWVENTTDNSNITIESMNLTVR